MEKEEIEAKYQALLKEKDELARENAMMLRASIEAKKKEEIRVFDA
jgi:hypothetical protein